MPAAVLSTNYNSRRVGHAPEIVHDNFYFEEDPTNPATQVALLSRPALDPFLESLGDGEIRGLYVASGVQGRDYLVVKGSTLSRVTVGGTVTHLGSIGGVDRVEVDSDGTNTYLVGGGIAYRLTGSTLTTVDVDGNTVASLAQFNSYIVFQVADSGRFYWIQPGETTVDPLDFATAERAPDPGVAIRKMGDFLLFLQTQGGELYSTSGDANAPFSRQSGIVYDKGCLFRDTAQIADQACLWVADGGDDNRVVVRGGQGAPQIISPPWLAEKMRDADEISATVIAFDGHEFYVLRIEGVDTFALDLSTQKWSRFASHQRDNWRAKIAATAPGGPMLLGDDENGKLYRLNPTLGEDDDLPMVRRATAMIPVQNRRSLICVSIRVDGGWAPLLTDNPVIEMEISKDGGMTWSDPRVRSIGRRGQFDYRIRWERCGEIKPPFALLRFTFSEAMPIKISYVMFDEVDA